MGLRPLRIAATITILGTGIIDLGRAGTFRYDTCFRNDGNVRADGFSAGLPAGGVFFGVTGTFVVPRGGFCVLPPFGAIGNVIPTQRFAKLPDGSLPSSFNRPFIPGVTIAPGNLMKLTTTRNGPMTGLTSWAFTAGGAPLLTAAGWAVISAAGDPMIDVMDSGPSAITITDFEAQVNNSQDPLDLYLDFVPDGKSVDVTYNDGLTIAPDATTVFDFTLPPGTRNWSFDISYNSSQGEFSQLVATDTVPEPMSIYLSMLGIGATLAGVSRSRLARRFRGWGQG
jgi:hypothetical protein